MTSALSRSFPIFQVPPPQFATSSFSVFLFYCFPMAQESFLSVTSNLLPLPQFVLKYHWLLLCMPSQFCIRENVSTKDLKFFIQHLFINICKSLVIPLVIFHVSHQDRRTDSALFIRIFIFVATHISLASWIKAAFAFWIHIIYSAAPPALVTTLPKYENLCLLCQYHSHSLCIFATFYINSEWLSISQIICNLAILPSLCKSFSFFSMSTKGWDTWQIQSEKSRSSNHS